MADSQSTHQPARMPSNGSRGRQGDAANVALVSVVVPVFNEVGHIVRSIESVLTQTWQNLEVIVVDDRSTDGTPERVELLADSRVRLVRQPVNRGPSAARNRGLLIARGRWIAFLDADDTWEPEKITRQMQALRLAGPSTRACTCGYRLFTTLRNRLITPHFTPVEFRNLILFGCTISPGSTLLVEHSVFARVGLFDETMRRLEDWDWLLRYTPTERLIAVPELLTNINYDEGEKFRNTADKDDPVLHAIEQIKAKHLSRLNRRSRLQARKFESTLWVEKAAQYYRKGEGLRACVSALVSLCIYPLRNIAFFRTAWNALTRILTR